MFCLDLLQVLIVLDFMEKGDMKSYLDYLTIRSEAIHTLILRLGYTLVL